MIQIRRSCVLWLFFTGEGCQVRMFEGSDGSSMPVSKAGHEAHHFAGPCVVRTSRDVSEGSDNILPMQVPPCAKRLECVCEALLELAPAFRRQLAAMKPLLM
jgi:hypothetical protein